MSSLAVYVDISLEAKGLNLSKIYVLTEDLWKYKALMSMVDFQFKGQREGRQGNRLDPCCSRKSIVFMLFYLKAMLRVGLALDCLVNVNLAWLKGVKGRVLKLCTEMRNL